MHLWLVVLVPILLVLTAMAVRGPVAGASGVESLDPHRAAEPVILTGADVPQFSGQGVEFIAAYRYTVGSGWTQIPFQIDEVDGSGTYVAVEDGVVDDNDELVWMAGDLGEQALWQPPGSHDRIYYEVEVTDPLNPMASGWLYLVLSGTSGPTFTTDYVDFDPALHRIEAAGYTLTIATTHPGYDALTLAGGSTDLLDRTKLRLFCATPPLCPATEDLVGGLPDDLVRDGPVRLILRDGKLIAYGAMLSQTVTLNLPLEGDIRYSTDFSPDAAGATLYSDVIPGGVTVDGVPDVVPATPVSPWWQLSHSSGSVIQVSDPTGAGGTQSNYYEDDGTVDPQDTGDQQRYGEVGLAAMDPNASIAFRVALYFQSETLANVGQGYQDQYENPLVAVPAERLGQPGTFIPVLIRPVPGS